MNTSYGEFFETKNNIRYFDYHRLDLSVRHIIYMRRFTIFLDADVYNVYNHKNTFYFKETLDETEQRYYFKNISLVPGYAVIDGNDKILVRFGNKGDISKNSGNPQRGICGFNNVVFSPM